MKRNQILLLSILSVTPLMLNGCKTIKTYEVTLISNIKEAGILSGAGVYNENTKVTIHAISNIGYQFEGWYENDILISDETSFDITILKDVTYTAKFKTDKQAFVDCLNNWVSGENGFCNSTSQYQINQIKSFIINGNETTVNNIYYSGEAKNRKFHINGQTDNDLYASNSLNGDAFKNYIKDASSNVVYTFNDDYISYSDSESVTAIKAVTFNKYGYCTYWDYGDGRTYQVVYDENGPK